MSSVSFVEGEKRVFEPELWHRKVEKVIAAGAGSDTALIYRKSLQNAAKLVTYDDLNGKANRMARFLLKQTRNQNYTSNVDNDWIIAISMEPSDELIVTLLAVLKTGAAFLPLDPVFPINRIEHIINEAKPVALIYTKKDPNWPEAVYANKTCITYKKLLKSSHTFSSDNLKSDEIFVVESDQNVAMIAYTSGSTGMPKGSRLPHSILMNHMNWQFEVLPFDENERITVLKTVFTFTDALREIFGPLFTGRQMLIIPETARTDIPSLVAYLDEYKIRRMIGVPALLRAILAYLHTQKGKKLLQNLTLWMNTSESLTGQLATEYYDYFDDKTHVLMNLFGSSEMSADILYYTVQGRAHARCLDRCPIGYPIFNTGIYALDDEMRPVPRGQQGQLYLTGKNVSLGYVNGREKDRFNANPLSTDPIYDRLYRPGDCIRIDQDGTVHYDGRTDTQVKVNCYRVDLTEIELEINKIPGISQAITLAYHHGKEDQAILAFILVEEGKEAELTEDAVKKLLETKLIWYQMPDKIISIESVPLTNTGKTDRQSLLKLYENEKVRASPETKAVRQSLPNLNENETVADLSVVAAHLL